MEVKKQEIESPDDPRMDLLCQHLADLAPSLRSTADWPDRQLKLCSESGVFKWFIPIQWGGSGRSTEEIVRGYIKLASACLTSTFVITQRTGACKRIVASENRELQDRLLPDLATGRSLATLGISHLTTSSQHLDRPVLAAREVDAGWQLNGFSPWVTGGAASDHIVIGAVTDRGDQILLATPTGLSGITVNPAHSLLALSSSQTGSVEFSDVVVEREFLLAGPKENVLKSGLHASTGGLQTSALAIGLASAAIRFVQDEANSRLDLKPNSKALEAELSELTEQITALARGEEVCTNEQLRTAANSFALRATQSALVAAKGAGFVAGHPVGRWCRESLFFLVWSCPQGVRDANLCEFAGILD